jgi:hypothetical protein
MATDMMQNYSLATDDEEYDSIPDQWWDEEEEEGDPWLDEYDYYDFPEDDGTGFFDPEESK